MLICKLYTQNYKHDYFFEFQGTKYRVHSVVHLTEKGRLYLGARNKEAILIEQFTNFNGVLCWKYRFQNISPTIGVADYATDKCPDELIESVVVEATAGHAEREIFGVDAPSYKTGKKVSRKDWEIPEVMTGWVILLVIFVGVMFFKDWYIRLIIRLIAACVFGLYRQNYINAYTTYVHEEDSYILQRKYEILYNIKSNKENDNNE